MITGELKSQVDRLWDAFWAGGIANPLEVIEQITYLLFIKRLDDLHTAKEKRANRLNRPIEKSVFTSEQQSYRWSRFKNEKASEMYKVVSEKVFPFIKELQSDREDSTYSHHMRDARFTIPTPALLSKVVDMIDGLPMEDRDTKGDLYEYMLGKIASAGQNGQFRTPRHIIRMMVEMVAPGPKDIICDPACGTGGFLVAASEYLREKHPEIFSQDDLRHHFNETAFNGFDFDSTMLGIFQLKDEKSHIVLQKCNSASLLSGFSTSRKSVLLRGQKAGSPKSAKPLKLSTYENDRETFRPLVGFYPVICDFGREELKRSRKPGTRWKSTFTTGVAPF